MSDRARAGAISWRRGVRLSERLGASRLARRPGLETLEGRIVLNAALASIPNVAVPSSLGYQVNLDGTASNAPSQTFSATSSNPDVKVSVAQGQFWTINVTHTAAASVPNDVSFSGPVTLQLFQDLTPKTASLIENFITQGYYNGKTLHRVASGFSGKGGPTDFVIQGGAPNPDGTGSSGLPGTPYGLELNQQLAFVNPNSLAIANTGRPNSNDTQFFFTTGPQTSLDFNYTIFGQVVAGFDTVAKIEQVATQANAGLGGEKSQPVTPITITSATLSNVNPNGVLHVDATGAVPGETTTVQVTATDPATKTTALQTFQVNVAADTSNHPATLTFKPLSFPVTQVVAAGTATTVQLKTQTENPNNAAVKAQYSIVSQPAHGTLSALNTTTGTVTYTPAAGFSGTDSFQYTGTNTGATPSPLPGNSATVTLNVGALPPVQVDTGTVRLIGTVLVVTPLPRTDGGTNTVVVSQTQNPASPASERLNVTVNGQLDRLQPLASSFDRIIVYGSRNGDNITVSPTVDPAIRVLLDGGHGRGTNVLQAGAGPTREHGWFGRNTLKGGSGPNELVGRAGHVRFVPTATTDEIFAGQPHPGVKHLSLYNGRTTYSITPPGGTFYKYVNGRLVPLPTPKPSAGRSRKSH